ncbi:hypothetical protein [Sulfitobacter sp. 1A12157]|uniref:hypothetical protein n=1 Tax=Sulfitobacter sp. 1A12157 TaxID=3368594 RepID=UPI003744CADA
MPTWLGHPVSQAEYNRLRNHYEEQAFQRRPTQGTLCCPMIISDTQRPLQSMADGKIYDSKSQMRRHYKEAGVVEVGNDVPTKRATPSRDERERAKKARKASVGRALSRAGFGAA